MSPDLLHYFILQNRYFLPSSPDCLEKEIIKDGEKEVRGFDVTYSVMLWFF